MPGWLMLFLAIYIIVVVGIALYFVFRQPSNRNIYLEAVSIPQGTGLSSIQDVRNICQGKNLQLATIDDVKQVMSRIGYTYCTRGYVDDATIIPVSIGASQASCPTPGLHEEASVFPCHDNDCYRIAFCLREG